MGCNTCNKSPCGCSGTTCATVPYYLSTPVCPEDNCQKIYCNQFTFGVCPCVSWNVPVGGGTALLQVPGIQGAAIGSYIWNSAYGYFQVVSVDAERGLLGITNTLITGNADPGTQIPKDTCFIVSPPPADTGGNSDLFPYVAIDFTAPANGDCLDITVTTINGIQTGDIISIGTGLYEVDAIISTTVITICNTGDGILPGTSVIAQDQFGNYQYPIYVTSSCCEDIRNDLEADAFEYTPVAVSGVVNSAATQTVGGGNALVYNNTSAVRTAQILAVFNYVTRLDSIGTAVDVTWTVDTDVNGGGWTSINPMPSVAEDVGSLGELTRSFTYTQIYTVAPGGTLTVAARASITNNGPDNIGTVVGALTVRGILAKVS